MQETVKERHTEMKLLKEMLQQKDKEISELKTKLVIEKESMDLRVKDYEQRFKMLEDTFTQNKSSSSAKNWMKGEEHRQSFFTQMS